MGVNIDDELVLGLGVRATAACNKSSAPSLTLSLFGDTNTIKQGGFDCSNDNGQDSAASSLSNVSVKRERERERDVGSEEAETEREDEDGSNGRKKLRLTKAQSALLEESFKLHTTLNPKEKQDLARELKLRPRQVEVWFQNRRARTKLKQTEVDCEFLKKCCETLNDENRRLRKELQELKALHPLYMPLAICPSCERNVAKRPQFYHPFTNP